MQRLSRLRDGEPIDLWVQDLGERNDEGGGAGVVRGGMGSVGVGTCVSGTGGG